MAKTKNDSLIKNYAYLRQRDPKKAHLILKIAAESGMFTDAMMNHIKADDEDYALRAELQAQGILDDSGWPTAASGFDNVGGIFPPHEGVGVTDADLERAQRLVALAKEAGTL